MEDKPMPKLDANIPIPPLKGGQPKYPWESMKVGDSFFAPVPHSVLYSASYARTKKHNAGYKTRSVVENGVQGCRTWRVK